MPMNRIRKMVTASIAALTTVTLLAACGGTSGSTAQESKPSSITIWTYESADSAMGIAWKKAMTDFTAKTGIKVNYELKSFEQLNANASQVLNSSSAPDVMEYNKGNATAGVLASQGLLANLNKYVKQYGWNKIITGNLATTGKYSDKGVMGSGNWYGITSYGEDVFMYYNKSMFTKYGIAIPTTFDELETALAAFKAKGVTPLSEAAQEYPLGQLWWQLFLMKATESQINAYQMYTGDVNWNSAAMKFATNTINDWVAKGYISKNSTGMKAQDAGDSFTNGTNPMFFSGTWWFGTFESQLKNKFEWTTATFPGAERVPGSSGNIWVIPSNSKKQDAAAEFIDYTLQPDIQTLMGNSGGVPINANLDKITDAKNQELLKQYKTVLNGDMLGYYPDWPTSTMYDDMNSALQNLVNGTTDTSQFLSTLKTKYDKGVEAAGVK